MNHKQPVVPGEHVLIITQVNPYAAIGGVGIILRNLLSVFNTDSYTFAYLGRFDSRPRKRVKQSDCFRLIPNFHPVHFIDLLFKGAKQKYAIWRAVRLAKARKAQIVVGLYPTLSSLFVATEVAKRIKGRFYPYLHDTISEGLSHTPLAKAAVSVQEDAFAVAESVLIINKGMSDRYRDVYNLRKGLVLQMSFPERIATEPNFNRSRTAFWGGDVYDINKTSLSRVQEALLGRDTQLELTCLSKLDFKDYTNVNQIYYPSRQEYIRAVQRHGMMILSIDWPDESPVHEAELSTIWPTKAVEYLATGAPILVHCPEHYFLARFFREHQCAVVVSDRSIEALTEAIDLLQSGGTEVQRMQERALALTDFFSIARVSSLFRGYLQGDGS